jgi:hypothetical protein
VRHWASQGHTSEQREKFDRQIDAPDTTASPSQVSEEVADEEMALFRKAMGER